MDKNEAGRLGGDAKQANLSAKLADAADHMPRLDSIENAKLRLEVISNLAVAGLLSGSQASAATKAVDIWLRAYQAEIDRNRMRQLEATIERLEKQLAGRGGMRRVG